MQNDKFQKGKGETLCPPLSPAPPSLPSLLPPLWKLLEIVSRLKIGENLRSIPNTLNAIQFDSQNSQFRTRNSRLKMKPVPNFRRHCCLLTTTRFYNNLIYIFWLLLLLSTVFVFFRRNAVQRESGVGAFAKAHHQINSKRERNVRRKAKIFSRQGGEKNVNRLYINE